MSDGIPTEPFAIVHDFPDYLVTSSGRVFSKRGRRNWRELKPGRHPFGYLTVSLTDGKRVMSRYVHRLVLTAFVGSCPAGMEACHNDGNPSNNHVTNLRWDTRRGNHADRPRHGTSFAGEGHPQAKLTAAQVLDIATRLAAGVSASQLAREFRVTRSCIIAIKLRQSWRDLLS